MTLTADTLLGRYEIRSLLGRGGMGEVYSCYDLQLERTVALKVLPADVAENEERMQRFVQEAKAASALNHPNILTIHEVGTEDSLHFIVTELVAGEPLRQRLAHGPMSGREVLEVGIQVASALSAAHQAGIVHRDIKPENISVRPDGYVKVVDFGLAKFAAQPSSSVDTEARTLPRIDTDPGVVLGTVAYMSPEQVRGLAVDARTDLWSLGVVLYEMVTGERPFDGPTRSDVIAAILSREPVAIAHAAADVPEALEWIVTKALTKDREERYQTAKELLNDLKRLRQRLDAEAERDRVPSSERTSADPATNSGRAVAGTAEGEATRTTSAEAAHTTSSAEYLVGEFKRHKRGAGLALVIVSALVVSLALFWP